MEQSGAHRPAQQNLDQRSHFETIPTANTRVFSPALSLLEQEGKLLPIGAGWRALLAQRWLGIGAGAFGSAHPIYLKAPSKVSFTHVESEGLQALAELGILWGTALILLVLLALTKLFRMAQEGTSAAIASFTAAVALLVQNLADFSLQFSGGVWLMAMLALGLAVEGRAGRKFSKNRVVPESRGRFSVLLPGTAALLLMLLLSPLALADLEKNSRKLSSELLSAQSLADIESALRRAQRLYPADSVLPLMAASVALQHQAPQRALSWSNTALLLAPYSGQAHLQAARAFVMLKKDDQALLHYRLALEMGESSTSEVLEHFGDVPSLISATPATLEASVHAAQQLFELRRFAEGLALLERDDGLSPLAPPPTKPCRDLEAPPSSDGLEGSSASGMESSDSESGSSVSGNELPVLERQNSVFEDAVPILGPQNSVAGDEVSAFGADISASEDVISVAGNEIPVLGPQNSVFGDGFAVLGAENSASGDEISGFGDEISVSGHEPSVPEGQSSVSRNEKDLKDSAFRRECGEMDAEMESKSVSPGLLRASEGRPGAPPFCIPTHLHHTPPLSSTTLRAFHYLRAVFAWHENRLELASQSANCLKLMAGEAPEGWLLEVEILRKKKDWDAAVERMVDARRKFPESTEVALAHARLLLAASEPEQAWTVLEALPPTMQPQLLAERHALRATVWLLRQQDEKAGEELKQAIELAPERRDLRSLWEERLKNRSRR